MLEYWKLVWDITNKFWLSLKDCAQCLLYSTCTIALSKQAIKRNDFLVHYAVQQLYCTLLCICRKTTDYLLIALLPYPYTVLACISQNTQKRLGPENFSGFFLGEFLESQKVFLKAPENTPDSQTRVFQVVFSGLLCKLDGDWSKLTPLHWVGFLTYSLNQNFPRKITGKLEFLLSFAHFQHHLSYVAWPLSGIKSVKKVWCKY